jgi:FkbH-like protein
MTPAKLSDRSDLIELGRPGGHFAATITLEPGYSRHQIDRLLFNGLLESGVPFDVSLLPEGDSGLKIIVLGADFVVFKETVEKKAKAGQPDIKCIVWDLDNTVWDGILVEDPNVRLRSGVIDLIKKLDQKGIVMSLVSKNDAEKALEKLKEFGIDEYFLYPQVNWLPKSQNIQQIAKSLNIGLDTFAFIDDNPFELAEVGETLPMVRCISVDHMSSVSDDPRFAGSDSPDAKNRRQYYRTAALREQTQASYGDNYIEFLAHSNIRLTIKRYESSDFERVAELVQRTNQLNFSGQKYKREEIADLVMRPEIDKYLLACADKFGSYGIVGFSIVKQTPLEIEVKDFMLSCRVQGKFIEKAFFGFLMQRQENQSVRRFRVNFMQTSRNTPAKQVLDKLNFVSAGDSPGLMLDHPSEAFACDFIQIDYQD